SGGDAVLESGGRQLRLRKPLIYQRVDGRREVVAGGFRLMGRNGIGFQVAGYDTTKPLILDPVLVYSTYVGGSGTEVGQAIAVDGSGNAFVTGFTSSVNFPTPSGGIDTTFNGGSSDAFIVKLNPSGSGLVYSTYLGGNDFEEGNGIGVD